MLGMGSVMVHLQKKGLCGRAFDSGNCVSLRDKGNDGI